MEGEEREERTGRTGNDNVDALAKQICELEDSSFKFLITDLKPLIKVTGLYIWQVIYNRSYIKYPRFFLEIFE